MTIPMLDLDGLIAGLGETHATQMKNGEIDMVEIEFLDDPNDPNRFFRIGRTAAGMVDPISLREETTQEAINKWGAASNQDVAPGEGEG